MTNKDLTLFRLKLLLKTVTMGISLVFDALVRGQWILIQSQSSRYTPRSIRVYNDGAAVGIRHDGQYRNVGPEGYMFQVLFTS